MISLSKRKMRGGGEDDEKLITIKYILLTDAESIQDVLNDSDLTKLIINGSIEYATNNINSIKLTNDDDDDDDDDEKSFVLENVLVVNDLYVFPLKNSRVILPLNKDVQTINVDSLQEHQNKIKDRLVTLANDLSLRKTDISLTSIFYVPDGNFSMTNATFYDIKYALSYTFIKKQLENKESATIPCKIIDFYVRSYNKGLLYSRRKQRDDIFLTIEFQKNVDSGTGSTTYKVVEDSFKYNDSRIILIDAFTKTITDKINNSSILDAIKNINEGINAQPPAGGAKKTFKSMTLKQLQELAKAKKIPYSKFNKTDLISVLKKRKVCIQ
jgi:hypothetical protein